jgi:hypothetical protein
LGSGRVTRQAHAASGAAENVTVTDWLYNHLTVQGAAAFAAASGGAGVVPWRMDFAVLEEDLFHRLLTGCTRATKA